MKKISQSEYKRLKVLKQNIKSIPEKETDEPLLESTVKTINNNYYRDDGFMSAMMLVMMAKMRRARRH